MLPGLSQWPVLSFPLQGLLKYPSPAGRRSDIHTNRGIEMVDRWGCHGRRLHDLWSVSLLDSSSRAAKEVNRPRTKVHGYELTTGRLPYFRFNCVEASAFLIATQLRKVFIQRYPVSFLVMGLGALGAGYYGNKYYRAIIKGEHVRQFEIQKKE